MAELVKDVASLTNISDKILNKLVDASIFSILETVVESVKNGETVSEVDIGIGSLSILVDGNSLKFKFIPNAKLREGVVDSIKQRENPMAVELDNSLVEKITNAYKEII